MESVPFSIKGVYQGLADCRGMVRLESNQLVIELETRDGIFGVLRSGVKTISIPYIELESVTFRRGFFRGGRLRICAHRLSTLANIPGQQGAEIELMITRRHRSKAMYLASTAKLSIAELSLEQVRMKDAPATRAERSTIPTAEPVATPGAEPTAKAHEQKLAEG